MTTPSAKSGTHTQEAPAIKPIYGEHSLPRHIDLSAVPILNEHTIESLRRSANSVIGCADVINHILLTHDIAAPDQRDLLINSTRVADLADAVYICGTHLSEIISTMEYQLLDAQRRREELNGAKK